MDYRKPIQESLDYIEDHLDAEISPVELARQADFSLYHYYRLFQSAMGMSLGQYLTRRRLLHGAWTMHKGSRALMQRCASVLIPMPGFTGPSGGNSAVLSRNFWKPDGEKNPAG